MSWLDTIKVALAIALGLALGCGDPEVTPGGAAGTSGVGGGTAGLRGAGGTPASDVPFLSELPTLEEYAALSAEGAEVKYLTSVEGTEPPSTLFQASACAFQNTSRFPYHLQFLRTFPDYAELSPARYEDLVLRRASRVMWGGRLKLFAATPHPKTGNLGVVSYTIYAGTQPSEALTVEDIREVDRKLKTCAPFAEERFVFTPEGAAQLLQVEPLREALLEHGVVIVEPALLRPGLSAEAYNEGEGYGYLTLVPPGADFDEVGPRDVVVCDAAPGDLSLVAGLLTVQPQSVVSHLNLRLREKAVPSASVPGIFENTLITGLANRLVRVSVSRAGVEVQPARLDDARAFWEARKPSVGDPQFDLETSDLRPFAALRAEDAAVFGAKAANLGELHGILAAENRVEGFAIPFKAFADFMQQNGLEAEVVALLADPLIYVDAVHKRARLSALRQRIRSGPLSEQVREALRDAAQAAYGDAAIHTRLRFRSSTNAEDLPGLSGAGLYESRSGCIADDLDADTLGPSECLTAEHETYLRAELERRTAEFDEHPERVHLLEILDDIISDLTEEKSADAAIRRVWSSLWSDRAFDDREYFGIDHRLVYMGIAVHPTFVGERLEAVVLTNLEPEREGSLYRVVSQLGEIGVVDPLDPTATPEVLGFRRSAEDSPYDVTLVSPSSLSPGGAPLWSDPALAELGRALFLVQDHFAQQIYPELDPLMLDIEVDVTMDGRIVLKQARPFATIGP